MPRIDYFKVAIEVGGEPASEFEDDEEEAADSDTVVTKYIEAVSGANFGIVCQVLPGYDFEADYLSFAIFLDGNRTSSVNAIKSKYDSERGMLAVRRHVSVGQGESGERFAFRFANLESRETLPDECVEDMRTKFKALGMISVQVWRKKIVGYQDSHSHDATLNNGITDSVPEKALKGRALSLATSLVPSGKAKSKSVESGSLRIGKRLDKNAVATFNFKYRSRKDLQILRILAEAPPPVLLDERPIEDLTPDELRELILRQNAQLLTIKHESEQKTLVKRERALSSGLGAARPSKIRRGTDEKAVHLLSSDDEAELFEVSASRTVSKKAEEVEVIDLLD